MPEEQDRWLDREMAERLLSGRPPATAADGARARAEALAVVLRTLTPEPLPGGDELPGEAEAVAAFHKARTARDTPPARTAAGTRTTPVHRRARRRPLRLSLATVLALGMVGGVAVAASTGVVRVPFGGRPEPSASTTVSADVTPGPHPAPTPRPGPSGDEPPSGPGGVPPYGQWRDGRSPGDGWAGGHRGGEPVPREITGACRELSQGRDLNAERRHLLDEAAGTTPVRAYCEYVLHGGPAPFTTPSPGQRNGQGGNGWGDEDQDHAGTRDQAVSGNERHRRGGTGSAGHGNGVVAAGGPAHHAVAWGEPTTQQTMLASSGTGQPAASPGNRGQHSATNGPRTAGTPGGDRGRSGKSGRGGRGGRGGQGGAGASGSGGSDGGGSGDGGSDGGGSGDGGSGDGGSGDDASGPSAFAATRPGSGSGSGTATGTGVGPDIRRADPGAHADIRTDAPPAQR